MAKYTKAANRWIGAGLIAFGALAAASVVTARHRGEAVCSTSLIQGTYGYSVYGEIEGVGPVSSVGAFDTDGRGNIQGTATASLAGHFIEEVQKGTYAVGENCRGTGTFETTRSGQTETVGITLVVTNNGDRIHFIGTNAGRTLKALADRVNTRRD